MLISSDRPMDRSTRTTKVLGIAGSLRTHSHNRALLHSAARVAPAGTPGWGYGYQWWRLDADGHDVWGGLGFGGQFLVVIPEYQLIGVINSWNLFGASRSSILGPFIQALLAAGAEPPL